MANKRKSDALEGESVVSTAILADSKKESVNVAPIFKKSRVTSETPGSSKTKAMTTNTPKTWQDIQLEGEDEGEVPIYDDCNEIRRKIRLLQKTPGWKVTHWLKDIGGINSNSYNRFMKDSGPTAGATNGVYYAAYKYFEKVRILECKKKTEKRKRNESEYPYGLSREDRRRVWVLGPA